MGAKRFFVRLFLVVGWVAAIFLALYLPNCQFLPVNEKSINIFTWGDTLDPALLSEFEKKTGIKVNLSYFSTNEELFVKMQATDGENYDLIVPSGYAVHMLKEANLLKPINKAKLAFLNDLNPGLMNPWYDPDNTYSLPFSWEVSGLGFNTTYFQNRKTPDSLSYVYDPEVVQYKLAINNDPVENISFASLYLFGKVEPLSPEEFAQVKQLLSKQRKWVEAYSDFRADYFLVTGNCPVAITTSTYAKRAAQMFDNIDFVVPKEGGFLTVESLCMSRATTKEAYIEELLNFLYTKESMIAHYELFNFFPATLSPLPELDLDPTEKKLASQTPEEIKSLYHFRNLVSLPKARQLWIQVKSF